MIFIVAGVSGSGKSTIGIKLAEKLKIPFYDGDDFHPEANKAKMKSGTPLNDEDRKPWLENLNKNMREWEQKKGAVLACSALKEDYREILANGIRGPLVWVFLKGTKELLQERMEARKGHFFSPALLDSQLQTIVYPTYSLTVDIALSPDQIVNKIMENSSSEIGLIGLGVMGRSLALNMADKGFVVSVYNRVAPGEETIVKDFIDALEPNQQVRGYTSLPDFVKSLKKPANIIIMVSAGKAVDQVIESLKPYLASGDLIIDCGNSHFEDTGLRTKTLAETGIEFMGTGVSGGEKGARFGPSIMPGGNSTIYKRVQPVFEQISAKDEDKNPCCTYIGPEGSGHFVKMIHNGIEYAEMQILAEAYFVMKNGLAMNNEQIADEFETWIESGQGSYLLEITVSILRKKEKGTYLLDAILDKAGQKGTGSWSSEFAFRSGIPLNTISEAVQARQVSALKNYRTKMGSLYSLSGESNFSATAKELQQAVYLATMVNHHIGFSAIKEASKERDWNVDLSETARIWTNGCIIRSELMKKLALELQNSEGVLESAWIKERVEDSFESLKKVLSNSILSNIPTPVMNTSLQYLLSITNERLPANLIQAQRDYFGAHTYQRLDGGDEFFHSNWE